MASTPKLPGHRPRGTSAPAIIATFLIATPTLAPPLRAQVVPVVINEIAAATDKDFQTPSYDAVELYNPTGTPADVSYWFISDSLNTFDKYRIPAGTVIPPGGYRVFFQEIDTTQPLGSISYDVTSDAFALRAGGEEVYVLSADAGGALTGYVQGGFFPASPDGTTLGRYLDASGVESYVPQSESTLGAANAPPSAGEVTISEILADPSSGSELPEYVELANLTDHTAVLSHPADPLRTWACARRSLPTHAYIPARGAAILTNGDPDTFRDLAGVPPWVPVFGVVGGLPSLSNSGETLTLDRPVRRFRLFSANEATSGSIDWQYAQVDRVAYKTSPPWPLGTRNLGFSLEKETLGGIGDDHGNWRASGAIDGTPGALPGAPVDAAVPDRAFAAALRTALGIAADADIPVASLRTLTHLQADSAGIADLSWIEYATGLRTISLRDNDIVRAHALLSLPGLVSVDLSENRIDRRNEGVLELLAARGVNVIAGGQKGSETVAVFPSPGLELAVRTELGIGGTPAIRAVDLFPITELFVTPGHLVTDLTGLELMPNLRRLSLTGFDEEDSGGPYFSDLAPLAGLTKLEFLDISQNAVADLSPISGLTALKHLNVRHNGISDIAPLAGLTELVYLDLGRNYLGGGRGSEPHKLPDITPLRELGKLRYLDLGSNTTSTSPTELSPLAGLVDLLALDVSQFGVTEAAPLSGLTELQSLSIGRNSIEDIAFLDALADLRVLDFAFPFPGSAAPDEIIDVSRIASLTKLRVLSMPSFEGSDVTPLFALPWIEHLTLPYNRLASLRGLTHQLDPARHSLVTLRVSENHLEIRPGSDDMVLIDGLTRLGTTVYYSPQWTFLNPNLTSPDLRISRGEGAVLEITWLRDPIGGFSPIECSADLETWTPFDGALQSMGNGTYYQIDYDPTAPGAPPVRHFRLGR